MALLVDLSFSQRQIAERGGFAQSHASTRDFGGEHKIRVALESLGEPYDLRRQPGARPRHSARCVLCDQDRLHPRALTEEALDGYCRQLEQLYNDAEPWMNLERRLRSGRRPTRIESMK